MTTSSAPDNRPSPSFEELAFELAGVELQIASIRSRDKLGVTQQILTLMAEYGITLEDLKLALGDRSGPAEDSAEK